MPPRCHKVCNRYMDTQRVFSKHSDALLVQRTVKQRQSPSPCLSKEHFWSSQGHSQEVEEWHYILIQPNIQPNIAVILLWHRCHPLLAASQESVADSPLCPDDSQMLMGLFNLLIPDINDNSLYGALICTRRQPSASEPWEHKGGLKPFLHPYLLSYAGKLTGCNLIP